MGEVIKLYVLAFKLTFHPSRLVWHVFQNDYVNANIICHNLLLSYYDKLSSIQKDAVKFQYNNHIVMFCSESLTVSPRDIVSSFHGDRTHFYRHKLHKDLVL